MPSIFITGASSGIGRETALMFLDAGWSVGMLARRRAVLEDVAAGQPNAYVYPGDVTEADAVTTAVDEFQAAAGRLDVVFNNAGIFTPAGLIDEIDLDHWYTSVNVNLTGMFLTARAAFAAMRRQSPQGGRIINNGSLSAYSPRPMSVAYTSTKHAITGLTKTLSLDGRAFDIACGQIDIGNAATPLVAGLNERALADNPDAELMPMMEVEDAAKAVMHMASLPPSANVQFMTVMATKMPYVGRG